MYLSVLEIGGTLRVLRRVADLASVAFRGMGESSSFPAEKQIR